MDKKYRIAVIVTFIFVMGYITYLNFNVETSPITDTPEATLFSQQEATSTIPIVEKKSEIIGITIYENKELGFGFSYPTEFGKILVAKKTGLTKDGEMNLAIDIPENNKYTITFQNRPEINNFLVVGTGYSSQSDSALIVCNRGLYKCTDKVSAKNTPYKFISPFGYMGDSADMSHWEFLVTEKTILTISVKTPDLYVGATAEDRKLYQDYVAITDSVYLLE